MNSLGDELSLISKYLEVTEFIVSDPFYESVKSPLITEMIDWFLSNYESAKNSVPYIASKGGYQYIYGGPYNPLKELGLKFPDSPIRDILSAVEVIEKNDSEWVRKGQY